MEKVENSITLTKGLIEEDNENLGQNWRKILKIWADL
jgi:hypothetical protein